MDMMTTSNKNIIEIKKKAITDMTNVFGPRILNYSNSVHVYFIPENGMINAVYTHPNIRLTFSFIGDDSVIIYDEDMKKTVSCSVIDSEDQTARERVQEIIQDVYNIQIYLD